MHPRNLTIKDYNYNLPDKKIAQFPLAERDQSKLLVYRNNSIREDIYRNIAGHIPENAMLVFNNTRVVEARVLFQKPTGGTIEIFALEPHNSYTNLNTAMHISERVWWKCLIGGAGKWKHGQVLQKQVIENGTMIKLMARIVERSSDNFTIEFSWEPASLNFSEILHRFGVIPIPPYLKRGSDTSDQERYQTIYAIAEGSVAAPTAGLHFTEHIFQALIHKDILSDFITLHVGAGTFMPVKSDVLSSHQMHSEFMQIEISFLKNLIYHSRDVFAVGTTSLRALESLYWMGVKCHLDPLITVEDLAIQQWEVYDQLNGHDVAAGDALSALLRWMEKHALNELTIKTSILIAPPYRSRLVRGLITNFHQPNSTLLLLVAAFIGEQWHKVYDYALQNNFRFLSYGDGCLLYGPEV